MVHLHEFMLVILAATFCKLTILLPTKKCKLYKIADLDKIGAPQQGKTVRIRSLVIYWCTFIDLVLYFSNFYPTGFLKLLEITRVIIYNLRSSLFMMLAWMKC